MVTRSAFVIVRRRVMKHEPILMGQLEVGGQIHKPGRGYTVSHQCTLGHDVLIIISVM